MTTARLSWNVAWLLALVVVAGSVRAQTGVPLDGPTYRQLVGEPFWGALAAAPCRLPAHMPAKGTTPNANVVALRADLLDRIGPLPVHAAGDQLERRRVYSGGRYNIDFVVIRSRLTDVSIFGYLATPIAGPPPPAVLLLHGAGASFEQAFSWRFNNGFERLDSSPMSGVGAALAEDGYAVLSLWISGQQLFWPLLPWSEYDSWGASLYQKIGRGSGYSIVMGHLLAAVDYLKSQGSASVAVLGWREGATLGLVLGAIDTRVTGVVSLSPPLDRRALRSNLEGVQYQSAFMQSDCAFDDPTIATLIAPRPLVFAYATSDSLSFTRWRRFVRPEIVRDIGRVYAARGAGARFKVVVDASPDGMGLSLAARSSIDSMLTPQQIRSSARAVSPTQPAQEVYPTAYGARTQKEVDGYLSFLPSCRPLSVAPDLNDLDSFGRSVEPIRREVRSRLGIPSDPGRSRLRTLTRAVVADRGDYVLEWVYFRDDARGQSVGGLLASPRHTLQSRPAVLSFDGNYAVTEVFGLPPMGKTAYLGAYGDYLARSGRVVFAPLLSPEYGNAATTILRAKDPSAPTGWSRLVPYYMSAVDFLRQEPGVDTTRVLAYGISYAGYAALITTAVDPRITGLVYSNPAYVNAEYFKGSEASSAAVWLSDVCAIADVAMRYLIAPRPLVWEAEAKDVSAYERYPLEAPQSIEAVYRALGIASRFHFVRHGGGHETRVAGLRSVLPF
jgi:dienelactone hydrolase